jgi:hypothetical protein
MNIKHNPQFDTQKVAELYSKKDGVPVKYVCTSALGSEEFAMDIFYRDTPHPDFGNRYFGLYQSPMTGSLMITSADKIDGTVFAMIKDDAGDFHYSAHRHDYKVVDGKMIDGGRAYTKTNTHTVGVRLKDGEFYAADIESLVDTYKKDDTNVEATSGI